MAGLVKIHAAIFIPCAWLDSPRPGEEQLSFRGDDREFTPHAVNTGRSRVEQEIVIDFDRELVQTDADTGRSKERADRADGTRDTREGKAETMGIGVTDIVWTEGCELRLRAEATNPLVEAAEPVTYDIRATIASDGKVHLVGVHDAFPCFEFYTQRDFGPFRTLYTYDYREYDRSPMDLAGPPECDFDVTGTGN